MARGTLQIGNPAVIAARTGCRVISDFRSADMAAGGQGAPLVPYFDWAVLTSPAEPRAVLNIGGIANITSSGTMQLWRTCVLSIQGPGNMVIDRLAWRLSDGAVNMDVGGKWAERGETNPRLLNRLLNHPFLWARLTKVDGSRDVRPGVC